MLLQQLCLPHPHIVHKRLIMAQFERNREYSNAVGGVEVAQMEQASLAVERQHGVLGLDAPGWDAHTARLVASHLSQLTPNHRLCQRFRAENTTNGHDGLAQLVCRRGSAALKSLWKKLTSDAPQHGGPHDAHARPAHGNGAARRNTRGC